MLDTAKGVSHFQKHCPGCFQLKDSVAVCPHCGYDEGVGRSSLFLPHGTILGGQYRVGRVLGRPGGFGITYLGWDVNLQQRVAIKEYLPREICQRVQNSLEVDVHTADDRRGFEFGKEQFLREARIVAKLDHPNIVRVRNFFNANSTAYLVMDYYEGMSLGDYLSSVRATLEPELAVPLITPILEGLQYVHERGLVHRDLKPHNIYLAAIGRPIVLDFGAARQAAGDRVQSLSVVLTEGYAPLEQYQRRAVQGPWTDVYGVAATLYRMLTGAAPPIALDRIGRDPVDDGGWAGIPEGLLPAMRMALAVRPSDRYQSADEFNQALLRYQSSFAGVAATPAAAKAASARPEVPLSKVVSDAVTAPRPAMATATPLPPPAPRPVPPPAVSAVTIPPPVVPAPVPITPAKVASAAPAAALPQAALPGLPPTITVGLPGAGLLPDRAPPTTRSDTGGPARLYRRADDRPPPGAAVPIRVPHRPLPERESPLRRRLLFVLMLIVLGVALYVLYNPPKPKPKPLAAPPVAAAPVAAPAESPANPAGDATAPLAPPELPPMVDLPGGSVRLREKTADAAQRDGAVSVSIKPFRLASTEVTVAEFRDFVQRTGYVNSRWQNYPCESAGGRLPDWNDPGYAQRDDFPVVCVSLADATAYAQWLSRVSGLAFRLPTEAEWEYAARAGGDTQYWWGERFKDGMAACQSCPPKVPTQPSAVKSFPPNAFGLYETSGNVREWTCSLFAPYEQHRAEQCGVANDTARVAVRGGSWQQAEEFLASGSREAYEPYRRNVWTGFRVAQDLTP